jgi:hypothetical protein
VCDIPKLTGNLECNCGGLSFFTIFNEHGFLKISASEGRDNPVSLRAVFLDELTTTTASSVSSLLTTTSPSSTSAPSTNFLQNPGFEDGSLNQWSGENQYTFAQRDATRAHSGSYFA